MAIGSADSRDRTERAVTSSSTSWPQMFDFRGDPRTHRARRGPTGTSRGAGARGPYRRSSPRSWESRRRTSKRWGGTTIPRPMARALRQPIDGRTSGAARRGGGGRADPATKARKSRLNGWSHEEIWCGKTENSPQGETGKSKTTRDALAHTPTPRGRERVWSEVYYDRRTLRFVRQFNLRGGHRRGKARQDSVEFVAIDDCGKIINPVSFKARYTEGVVGMLRPAGESVGRNGKSRRKLHDYWCNRRREHQPTNGNTVKHSPHFPSAPRGRGRPRRRAPGDRTAFRRLGSRGVRKSTPHDAEKVWTLLRRRGSPSRCRPRRSRDGVVDDWARERWPGGVWPIVGGAFARGPKVRCARHGGGRSASPRCGGAWTAARGLRAIAFQRGRIATRRGAGATLPGARDLAPPP